ncbi:MULTISPECIES: hypothetical protein [Rhizobium]|uniref:hypothetical protein n=1 Tax=Rhizobium TaxID=379 RepID=UPI001147793F|nr:MULTISPECIES: hypothetical protein [Rhizobium]UFS81581.1 hypothetical protein LPB79_25245 [Rhizobium sp. T136]
MTAHRTIPREQVPLFELLESEVVILGLLERRGRIRRMGGRWNSGGGGSGAFSHDILCRPLR